MKIKRPSVSAIVPAAGTGSRMNSKTKKQFLEINGKPVIAHTLIRLSFCEKIDEIIVVTGKDDILYMTDIIKAFGINKVGVVTAGGATRQESVEKGALEAKGDYLLIHDGARPLITRKEIEGAIEAGIKYRAAAVGIPLEDTIKLSDEDGFSIKTLPRDNIIRIQTPQVIEKKLYFEALSFAKENNISATDDISLVEALGIKPKITPGSRMNIKITRPDDIETAEKLI